MSETCELPLQNATSEEIRQLLKTVRTIAVVGLSNKPERDSYHVAEYMQRQGYRIIPVNPSVGTVLGETAYDRLEDVPDRIDLVNIFRRLDAVPEVVTSAINIGARAVWMQEGIVHNAAAQQARDAGLQVVMNKCLLKEHRRL
jgi:predicted CoA-binding protein